MRLTMLFQIDGHPLPVPTAMPEFSYANQASEDSGNDEAGYLHQQIVRYDVLTCTLTYDWMTTEEYAYMLGLFRGKETISFTCPVPGSTAETTTLICHIDSWQAAMFAPERNLWSGLSLTIQQN